MVLCVRNSKELCEIPARSVSTIICVVISNSSAIVLSLRCVDGLIKDPDALISSRARFNEDTWFDKQLIWRESVEVTPEVRAIFNRFLSSLFLSKELRTEVYIVL